MAPLCGLDVYATITGKLYIVGERRLKLSEGSKNRGDMGVFIYALPLCLTVKKFFSQCCIFATP
jgi:hypothetical protein